MFSEPAVMPEDRSSGNSAASLRSVCAQFLAASQNADGGWGHHPGSESGVEPTAWALIGLAALDRDGEASDSGEFEAEKVRGFEWLHRIQLPDGSWPAFKGLTEGCWATSLVGFALAAHHESTERVARGVKWLVETRPGEASLLRQLQRRFSRGRSVARQNLSLHGWSWTPGTASWVEPTAYALILLSSVPQTLHPPGTAKRISLAENMLYDRMCPGGGWNTGNPEVYSVAGLPRIGPTVWALLALRRYPSRPENQQSLRWLEQHQPTIRGPGSLALANLALVSYGRPVEPLAPALEKMYEQNRFFQSVIVYAWAAIALGGKLPWNPIEPAPARASES